jgi:hypothetical protein
MGGPLDKFDDWPDSSRPGNRREFSDSINRVFEVRQNPIGE